MKQVKILFVTFVLIMIASSAWSEEVVVTSDFCDQYLVDHTPSADVGYKPDEDEDMGPPADIGGAMKVTPPKTIQIPIRFDLEKYFNLQPPNPQSQINKFIDYAKLGYITVNDDGRLYFNNQPLFNEDEQRLKEACRQLKAGG